MAVRQVKRSAKKTGRIILAVLALILVAAVVAALLKSRRHGLVVYCAHDSLYAEEVLKEFTRRTGIKVAVRFDSEATKSLGLVELLLKEKDHPRCDVFWNNELLGTLQLAENGVLSPYRGPGYERIPTSFRDPAGLWCGFAARLRVWIVNTDAVDPQEVTLPPDDLTRTAIAKPLYGTTRTHYTVLWHLWGGEKLQAWHRQWRDAGAKEASGNAAVKNLVGDGVCDIGLTDTDDFFVGLDAGKPVAMLPVRVDGKQTICIPNTVAIIHGTRRSSEARQLVDFLLSEQSELALANSKSRQIPLGPVDESKLPDAVRELQDWAADGYPLSELDAARRNCLAWLKEEYLH